MNLKEATDRVRNLIRCRIKTMEENKIKLALYFGKYSAEEISLLRSLYPITHREGGGLILDERE